MKRNLSENDCEERAPEKNDQRGRHPNARQMKGQRKFGKKVSHGMESAGDSTRCRRHPLK